MKKQFVLGDGKFFPWSDGHGHCTKLEGGIISVSLLDEDGATIFLAVEKALKGKRVRLIVQVLYP